MLKCIFGGDAFRRHPLEALFDEVGTILNILIGVGIHTQHIFVLIPRTKREQVDHFDPVILLKIDNGAEHLHHGRLDLHLLVKVHELLFRWLSDNLLHLDELEALRVTWEKWPLGHKLKEDAAGCPDVNGVIVPVGAENELGCAVVSADYIRSIHRISRIHRIIQNFTRSNIAYPDHTILK